MKRSEKHQDTQHDKTERLPDERLAGAGVVPHPESALNQIAGRSSLHKTSAVPKETLRHVLSDLATANAR